MKVKHFIYDDTKILCIYYVCKQFTAFQLANINMYKVRVSELKVFLFHNKNNKIHAPKIFT